MLTKILLFLTAVLLLATAVPTAAQVITQVSVTPGFGAPGSSGILITVSYSDVPSNYWIGLSIRRPNGRIEDRPPVQAGTMGGAAFNYPSADCMNTGGYRFAAAIWRGYDGRKMVGLVNRFRNTIWVPMGCPAVLPP